VTCSTNWEMSRYWETKLTAKWVTDFPGIPAGMVRPGFPVEQISDLLKHGKYAAELLKEFVFEEVRQEQYSSMPSRRKCLFAFPSSLDPHEYAASIGLSEKDGLLLEIDVAANAAVHYAEMKLLDCNGLVYAKLRSQAARYWETDARGSSTCEILVDGDFRVIRVVRL